MIKFKCFVQMKRINLLLLIIIVSLYSFLLFYKENTGALPTSATDKPFEPLWSVFRLIRSEYIEEKNPQEIVDGALKGLINSLDPLSGYLDQKATNLYLNQQKEISLYDVGILLMKRYDIFPVVVGLISDSPASKEDIKVGDYITEINGKSTSPLSLVEVRLLLRSTQKNPVTLKILRGEQTRVISLEREKLFSYPYKFRSQPGTAGWLEIFGFFSPLTDDFIQKIVPQIPKTRAPLIIDLRTTQEGQLNEALRFLNQFIMAEKIAYYQGRSGEPQYLGCPQRPSLPDVNLAIWVSAATQDLAELVAAALQDKKKAPVIGQPTSGLLAKREFFLLRDGTSFFLTTAIGGIYPDKTLWNKGVDPTVKLGPEENSISIYLKKTLEIQSLP